MDTLWGFGWWWWCFAPLLAIGLFAMACFFLGGRRGCPCGSGMRCGRGEAPPSNRGPGA